MPCHFWIAWQKINNFTFQHPLAHCTGPQSSLTSSFCYWHQAINWSDWYSHTTLIQNCVIWTGPVFLAKYSVFQWGKTLLNWNVHQHYFEQDCPSTETTFCAIPGQIPKHNVSLAAVALEVNKHSCCSWGVFLKSALPARHSMEYKSTFLLL